MEQFYFFMNSCPCRMMTCVSCVIPREIWCVVTFAHELFIHTVTYQL